MGKNVIIHEAVANGGIVVKILSTESAVKAYNKNKLLKAHLAYVAFQKKAAAKAKEAMIQASADVETTELFSLNKAEQEAFSLIIAREKALAACREKPEAKTLVQIKETGKMIWVSYKASDKVGNETAVTRSIDKGTGEVKFYRV